MTFEFSITDTPLLLIAWRRPDTLRQVIAAIRPLAPKRLFVACDGPNPERPGEAEKVAATRAVIEDEIDWPCKIERLYADVNQGCSIGPIRAITWFFEQVQEGIILEDDCIPHPDFFSFCATLLHRYRHDTRVWCISGNNFQSGQWRGSGSYYFSRIPLIWGWATWRRCWQHYDADLSHWPTLRDSGLLETIFQDSLERSYWTDIWERTHAQTEPITWWDYQWAFTCLVNGGLCAEPNRNLVSNVGIGEDATHTTRISESMVADLGIGELHHPSFLIRDEAACRYCFENHFGGAEMRKSLRLLSRLKVRLKKALRNPMYYPKKLIRF